MGTTQSNASHTITFTVPSLGFFGATKMRIVSHGQANSSFSADGPMSACAVGDFSGTWEQPWYGATEDYSVVISGIIPATYLWSTGDTTASITGLSAGTYSCVVTDTNGCFASDTITITEPTGPLSVSEALSLIHI